MVLDNEATISPPADSLNSKMLFVFLHTCTIVLKLIVRLVQVCKNLNIFLFIKVLCHREIDLSINFHLQWSSFMCDETNVSDGKL